MFGPGDGPLEMYLGSIWTRRKNREKDSRRYLPESGHIKKRYGELERAHSSMIVQDESSHELYFSLCGGNHRCNVGTGGHLLVVQ